MPGNSHTSQSKKSTPVSTQPNSAINSPQNATQQRQHLQSAVQPAPYQPPSITSNYMLQQQQYPTMPANYGTLDPNLLQQQQQQLMQQQIVAQQLLLAAANQPNNQYLQQQYLQQHQQQQYNLQQQYNQYMQQQSFHPSNNTNNNTNQPYNTPALQQQLYYNALAQQQLQPNQLHTASMPLDSYLPPQPTQIQPPHPNTRKHSVNSMNSNLSRVPNASSPSIPSLNTVVPSQLAAITQQQQSQFNSNLQQQYAMLAQQNAMLSPSSITSMPTQTPQQQQLLAHQQQAVLKAQQTNQTMPTQHLTPEVQAHVKRLIVQANNYKLRGNGLKYAEAIHLYDQILSVDISNIDVINSKGQCHRYLKGVTHQICLMSFTY